MTQLTQADTGGDGNTSSSPPNPRCRIWSITVNNFTADEEMTLKLLGHKRLVYQIESGEEKTVHIQAHIEFQNARSFKSIKKKLSTAHIEKVRNREASIAYCQKPDTRVRGPYLFGFPKPLKLITEMRPWQQNIIDLIDKEADDRTIHWFWDEAGGCGKTSLAKYICSKRNALYLNGKSADIKYLVSKYLEADETRRDDLICIFNYSRTIEEYISYQALEEIKDGLFMSTKYESNMIIMNCPHVIVFANFPPKLEALSKDRWKVTKIT